MEFDLGRVKFGDEKSPSLAVKRRAFSFHVHAVCGLLLCGVCSASELKASVFYLVVFIPFGASRGLDSFQTVHGILY